MSNTDPTKNYNGWATRTVAHPLEFLVGSVLLIYCSFLLGSVSLIYCSFWLDPCCSSIAVFGWVRVAHHGPNQKLQWMSNTDPTKNYNRWATRTPTKNYNRWAIRTQPKTPMDERPVLLIHCSFWLRPCRSSIVVFCWGPCCSSIVVFGWVRVKDPTKNYNRWATRTTTKDYNRWATQTQP
jgi:hypothetical protein